MAVCQKPLQAGQRKSNVTPLVSILIPAFNAEAWIAETIRSALSQTWEKKEIIVVDDGSTDATLAIARQYESSALKVIHQENSGACHARNRAMRACQGDYIQWLDADDLLSPDKIERQLKVAEIENDPYLLFSCRWGRFFYRPSNARFQPNSLWRDLTPIDWLNAWLSERLMMANSAWLVSRQITDKSGSWDERLTLDDDGEYFSRVVCASELVKFVPEACSYYRIANPSSLSRSVSLKSLESLCLSVELTVDHLLNRDDGEPIRKGCVRRLNEDASRLEGYAPDMARRLRDRIGALGGEVVQETRSSKYTFLKGIVGERNARLLKEAEWRARCRFCGSWDRLLGSLFGNGF